MASRTPVPDILDRMISGQSITDAQLEAAASAAASLRKSFLGELFVGLENLTPHTSDFEAFKRCLKGMIDLLMKHGIIGVQDAQLIWIRVEEIER